MLVKDLLQELNNTAFKFDEDTFEGHILQAPYFSHILLETINMLEGTNKKILQIGFNAGHSTAIMLLSDKNPIITSVDINYHKYVVPCSKLIDEYFPNRHTLILGDSKEVLKTLTEKYDMFFVDGDHNYETAYKDIENCIELSNGGEIIIMDDVVHLTDCSKEHTYTIDPTRVWKEFIASGKIKHFAHTEINNRGMSIGIIMK